MRCLALQRRPHCGFERRERDRGDDLAEVVDDRVVGSRILAQQAQERDRQKRRWNSDISAS